MSDTPRTDAATMYPGSGIAMVRPEFARCLEIENNELRLALARAEEERDQAARMFDKQLEINEELRQSLKSA